MYGQATFTDVFSVLCQIGQLCIISYICFGWQYIWFICIADQNILERSIQTNKQAWKQTYKPSQMYSRTLHLLWMFAAVRRDPQVHQTTAKTEFSLYARFFFLDINTEEKHLKWRNFPRRKHSCIVMNKAYPFCTAKHLSAKEQTEIPHLSFWIYIVFWNSCFNCNICRSKKRV